MLDETLDAIERLVEHETLDAIERERLSLALLPPWYDVDDAASLRFLADVNRARRIARQDPLRHCERALAALSKG